MKVSCLVCGTEIQIGERPVGDDIAAIALQTDYDDFVEGPLCDAHRWDKHGRDMATREARWSFIREGNIGGRSL